MSAPYEKMLQSARSSSHPNKLSSASSSTTTPRDNSSTSSKKLSSVKRPKPNLPFFVKPRYRFDLPDPPMDLKMVLGKLCTDSFSKPFVSDLEKEFRPIAIPSDPSHALRANLSNPAKPCLSGRKHKNGKGHVVTIDDDALLQSVINARILGSCANNKLSATTSDTIGGSGNAGNGGGGKGSVGSGGTANISGVGKVGVAGANGLNQIQANNVSNAPWMRRMSYDEYAYSSTNNNQRSINIKQENNVMKNKTPVKDNKEKRRKQLLASFTLVKQPPVHPDSVRKGHLKPVSVVPVFPEFKSLGSDLILLDFDNDQPLTAEHRVADLVESGGKGKEISRIVMESIQSLASVCVADGVPNKNDEPSKKVSACYTPTDATLEKRARKRCADEESDAGEEDGKDDAGVRKKKARKICFVDEENYEWIGEYVIREGMFVEGERLTGGGNRSCFAVRSHESKDRKQRVACFSRLGTSWKMSRKPVDENTGRLGKDRLILNRNPSADSVASGPTDDWKRRILTGTTSKANDNSMLHILEQD